MEVNQKEREAETDVSTVGDLLLKNLEIPYYQRPYRWHAENHVKQLIQDIIHEIEKKNERYRIGTIILHCTYENTSEKLNIVDGQQRLVTLSLILHALEAEASYTSLLNQKFTHVDSRNNLKYNYNYITTYLSTKSKEEKDTIKRFILQNCEILKINLFDLSEAFQLFDSQNARGKTLDPADLLKAYHLREMDGVYESEKHRIVNRWEEAIEKKKLNDVLGNYLFRLRNWRRSEMKYFFSKNNVDEFKGVTPAKMISNNKHYPYLDKLLVDASSIYFEYNQPIVNGKWFFAYVSYYTDLVERVDNSCMNDEIHPINYNGSGRIGDRRLIKLYKNMLLVYIDKFGEDQHFKKYKSLLYRWVFISRLEKVQVRFETILKKFGNKNHPIYWISKWHHPELDAMEIKLKSIKTLEFNKERKDFNSNDGIYKLMKTVENQKIN